MEKINCKESLSYPQYSQRSELAFEMEKANVEELKMNRITASWFPLSCSSSSCSFPIPIILRYDHSLIISNFMHCQLPCFSLLFSTRLIPKTHLPYSSLGLLWAIFLFTKLSQWFLHIVYHLSVLWLLIYLISYIKPLASQEKNS